MGKGRRQVEGRMLSGYIKCKERKGDKLIGRHLQVLSLTLLGPDFLKGEATFTCQDEKKRVILEKTCNCTACAFSFSVPLIRSLTPLSHSCKTYMVG
jgi:hypothetical protein